jgi:D-alanyl-lipoteichoic acid acyltransferase DltB (MBOAT superfamily)
MPFTGYPFLVFFLPMAFAGVAVARKFGRLGLEVWWLILVSLVFCAWSNPRDLIALAASIAANFQIGRAIHSSPRRKILLVAALTFDCALLLGFKLWAHAMPLGISFYTFVQINYLLEIYRRDSAPAGLADYLLLVTFFPKFTAGPIIRPADFLAQRRSSRDEMATGAALFAMGFAKKLLADHCAQWAAPVFASGGNRADLLGACDVWIGVLAYTLQIYFDFSGYCDMAIGLGALLGWRVPVNFNSPYRALSMIDFWRRWHITLTSFLTENVFFRLPGQRKGLARRNLNLLITMVVCGFWHGSGWTFVVWGAFHAVCLIVNHAWRKVRPWKQVHAPLLAWAVTFLCVLVGWALFAARTLDGGMRLILRMFGAGGPIAPHLFGATVGPAALWIAVLAAIACTGPNTQEIAARYRTAIEASGARLSALNPSWIVPGLATLWLFGVMLFLTQQSSGSPFIYAVF